jgi:hypothetical protein
MNDNPYQAPQTAPRDRPFPQDASWWRAAFAAFLLLTGLALWGFIVPAVGVLALLGIYAMLAPRQESAVAKPAPSVSSRLSNAAFLVEALCALALPVAILNNPDWSLYEPPLVYIWNALLALIAIRFAVWVLWKFVRR